MVKTWVVMQAMAFGSGFVFDPKPAKRRVEAIIRLTCGYFILQAGYLVLLKYLVLRRRPDDPEKSLHMENFYSDADDGKDRLSFVQVRVPPASPVTCAPSPACLCPAAGTTRQADKERCERRCRRPRS